MVDGVILHHTGTFATSFTTCVTTEIKPFVLADVGAHVLAVHVRTGQVQFERVGAGVLATLGECLPVAKLLGRCPIRP